MWFSDIVSIRVSIINKISNFILILARLELKDSLKLIHNASNGNLIISKERMKPRLIEEIKTPAKNIKTFK